MWMMVYRVVLGVARRRELALELLDVVREHGFEVVRGVLFERVDLVLVPESCERGELRVVGDMSVSNTEPRTVRVPHWYDTQSPEEQTY